MTSKSRLMQLPTEILLLIKDYLLPSEVKNFDQISPLLWTCMFKNDNWLRLAKKIDTTDLDGYRPFCNPLLIGYKLSSFRTDGSNKGRYFILFSGDYSGDLRYAQETFFASLRDDHEYHQKEQEIQFQSGLTVNVSAVMSGTNEPRLPMRRLFPSPRARNFRLEYLFLNEASPMMRTLTPPNIIGINGPGKKRHDVRYGCVLHTTYQGGIMQWLMFDQGAGKELDVDKRGPAVDMRDQCPLIMSMQVRDS